MAFFDRLSEVLTEIGADIGALRTQLGLLGAGSGAGSNVKDVTTFGGVMGDDPTKGAANAVALRSALDGGGRVYIPAGVFWCEPSSLATEAGISDATNWFGAGRGKTFLKLTAGTGKHWNLITNALNDRTSKSTTNKYIRVADMTIDANAFNRSNAGTPDIDNDNTSGCCIGFAGVEHVIVERVNVLNGYLHGVSIDASVYSDSTQGAAGRTLYPAGKSRNVVVRDFFISRPRIDDGATCHGSDGVTFMDGEIYGGADVNAIGATQNGMEIDEAMIRGRAIRVRAVNWVKGFQIKGHPDTAPAQQSLLDSCTSVGCNVGVAVEWASSAASPNLAKGVEIRDHTSKDPQVIPAYNDAELFALTVSGYRDVRARLLADGGPGNGIVIYSSAKDVELDVELDNGAWTTPPTAAKGFIQTDSTVEDIKILHVKARTPVGGTLVSSFHSGVMHVDDVSGDGTGTTALPMVRLQASVNGSQTATNLKGSGWQGLSRVATGMDAGYYQGDYKGNQTLRTADWTSVTLDSAKFSAGTLKYTKIGHLLYIKLRNAAFIGTSGQQTLCTLPAELIPDNVDGYPNTPSFVRNTGGTGTGTAIITSAGAVQVNMTNGSTYNGDLLVPIERAG